MLTRQLASRCRSPHFRLPDLDALRRPSPAHVMNLDPPQRRHQVRQRRRECSLAPSRLRFTLLSDEEAEAMPLLNRRFTRHLNTSHVRAHASPGRVFSDCVALERNDAPPSAVTGRPEAMDSPTAAALNVRPPLSPLDASEPGRSRPPDERSAPSPGPGSQRRTCSASPSSGSA